FKYVLAQELPTVEGGAFIHLDMVFTLLNHHECMVYKPVIYNINYKTVLLEINSGKICNITYVDNLIEGLKKCNKDYEPVFCGNNIHNFEQREQWHSGANFFALAPGKVIGYERNVHTNEALAKQGFSMVKANDFIKPGVSLDDYEKCVITIEGSELSRGGGGPRCMTMPISRE
ncbi:MAG: arginine deiminase family protein, partial [Bacteroidales bacterium]|nr:arginine deiminase family protein [Bacteroidales bacterium]